MITNFEEYTGELNEKEKLLLPHLINGFKTRSKDTPIKAPEIVKKMNRFAEANALPKMNEVRLRKMVNFIRTNGMLPLIATSSGYYVSHDKTEIRAQIKSLEERARSIDGCAKGLYLFL